MATGNILAEGNVDKAKIISRFLSPTQVNAATTSVQSFTVPGLIAGSWVWPTMTTSTTGIGIVDARCAVNDTLTITFMNATAVNITPTANTFRIMVVSPDATLASF